jgi:hypothetical protein
MSHYQSGAEHDTKGFVNRSCLFSFLKHFLTNVTFPSRTLLALSLALLPPRYSMRDGASFAEQAKGSTMDLTGDDGITALAAKPSQLTWDRKKKKFVKGDGVGADNQKIVRTESGARLPATFKSGRFDEWKAKNKKSLPRVGDAEPENAGGRGAQGLTGADGRRFRHNKITEAKPLDKKSTTYERKVRIQEGKKRAAAEEMAGNGDGKKKSNKGGRGVGAAVGGRGGKSASQVKNEIRSVDQIKKKRAIEQKVRLSLHSLIWLFPLLVVYTDSSFLVCLLPLYRKRRRTLARRRRAREERGGSKR